MSHDNQNFRNSLRCLQHPVTWLSIALLVINDHMLKVVSPSWLTGKLSDFAGLFFFPFIAAAGLSLLLSKSKITARGLGLIALGFTAGWFVLIKTFPPVNSLTTQIAAMATGLPAHFTADPTDLVALLAMLPAWKIWTQVNDTRPTRLAYLALIFGSLAAMATSPAAWTVNKVTNLEYYKDGIVLAADPVGWGGNTYPVAESLDGGATWEISNDIDNIEQKSLPVKKCSHLNPEICYQVTQAGQFQEHAADGTWVNFQWLVTTRVNDMILFEWEGKEYVIIAAGESGIWRRALPDGGWEKIPVLNADQ